MMEVAAHGHQRTHERIPSIDQNRSYHQPVRTGQSAAMSAIQHGGQSALIQSKAHTSSNYSMQSQPSSRSSDGTQGTAHSTLFPPPLPMPSTGVHALSPPHGDVTATDNIMNMVANAESSLFQICVSLRQRLMGVPGFSDSLLEEEDDADEDTDPVTLLWRTFRRGYPLVHLYNALQPPQPLVLGAGVREGQRGKAATFKFLQACINDLKFPADECFIVTDLYGDDTTGFVKVARVVNRVLDILVQRGLVEDIQPTASDFEQAAKGIKRTQRQHIVSELVTTERTYVKHLELLQAFKHLVEEKGIIAGDAVHDIFLNLNALLDFQRRFLIRVEQTNALPEDEQNWGKLFVLYCEAFKVYEPYIANQRKCEVTVVAEFSKLKDAGGNIEMRQMVESPTALYGFLMKPFQRLTKYPLLLEDLYKKGDLDEARKADLLIGKEASTSVLSRTNQAIDREEKVAAVQELKIRVEDWKGHRVEGFGELLLYGTFTVLKSENLASGKDGERQYHVYLFETILLCCKDIDMSKPKNKLSSKQLVDRRGKPKLQLKGRIFMQNVTDLVSLAKPGSYTCQIFWKGDPSIENFVIRFTTEDAMKKWATQIESQRRRYREKTRNSDGSRSGGTSVTEFTYMQNQPVLENPYAQSIDEDEEDDAETLVGSGAPSWQAYPNGRDLSQSRNGSNSSLRSRSTTGESSASGFSRAAPPRLPSGSTGGPALSLRTRELQEGARSPGDRANPDSYFSPMNDSPTSSRASSGSGVYPFPRQAVPQNGYYEDGHGGTRFTAPAMPRPALGHTQTTGPSNGYAPPGRTMLQRPGFPGVSSMHSAQQLPTGPRHRSASSPDIHNAQRGQLRNTTGAPPVPDMPATYQQHPHMIPRSQNNSPNMQAAVQSRNANAPPQYQRERSYQQPRPTMEMSPTSYGYEARPEYRSVQQHPNTRAIDPIPSRDVSPSLSPPSSVIPTNPGYGLSSDLAPPTQVKVKVHCPSASQVLTLVVPLNISYQSLKDRIDAKLQRSTTLSLGDRGPKENQVKLKYLDEDDFVSIQSDEDVQTAFETWREQRGADTGGLGGMGEIELFCQR